MDRRRFLAGSVLGGLGAYLGGSLTAEAGGDAVYRGTDDGRILCTHDDGATWIECADFGAGCRVGEVQPVGLALTTTVRFEGHGFRLYSFDGRQWSTSPGTARSWSRRSVWSRSFVQSVEHARA